MKYKGIGSGGLACFFFGLVVTFVTLKGGWVASGKEHSRNVLLERFYLW